MTIGPFAGRIDDDRVLVIGFLAEIDDLLVITASGLVKAVPRQHVVLDWRYDEDSDSWGNTEIPTPLLEQLQRARRGLYAIAAYDHTATCPNRADFTVWDCNCQPVKPDQMAQMTLEALEEGEDANTQKLVESGAS